MDITISVGARSTEPQSNGGSGSYSNRSWIALAVWSSAIVAARVRLMSMPADTPAAVMYFPSRTTRAADGRSTEFVKPVEGEPMSGRPATGEKTGGGQDDGTGAGGGGPGGVLIDCPQPVLERPRA